MHLSKKELKIKGQYYEYKNYDEDANTI